MVQIKISIKILKKIFMEVFSRNMEVRLFMEEDRQLMEEVKLHTKLVKLQWR